MDKHREKGKASEGGGRGLMLIGGNTPPIKREMTKRPQIAGLITVLCIKGSFKI